MRGTYTFKVKFSFIEFSFGIVKVFTRGGLFCTSRHYHVIADRSLSHDNAITTLQVLVSQKAVHEIKFDARAGT